jgi:hypothetical protein
VGVFGRHAVAVALEVDERGARDPDRLLDVAVEGPRVGHHLHLLVLQQVGNGERRPFRMGHRLPGRPALLGQPGVEFIQVGPAPLAGFLPDLPAPILDVLLDDALLPAGGPVAEFGIEQVMAAHGEEARIDVRSLPRPTLSTAVFMLS